ncbi:MAG TPA: Coq4 family protein [Bdellovibrionales bacterium]|nr:Coq4 family protein [Bdellovibrionales bacterium]
MKAFKNAYHLLSLARLSIIYALRPKDVTLTFKFADHLIGLGAYSDCEKALNAQPQAMDLIRTRERIQPVSLAELLRTPPGTLGHEFARHMIGAGLQPDFYPNIAIESDAHYVLQRLRSIHDLVHLATGYDTSEDGEIGLQCFLMAQLRWPFAMLIVGGTIFVAPFQRGRHDFTRRMEIIVEAWRMGTSARPVFAYDWNRAWTKPLEQVREELGIRPSRIFGFATPPRAAAATRGSAPALDISP